MDSPRGLHSVRGLSARVGVEVGDWGVIYGDMINVVGDYTLRSKNINIASCRNFLY